MLISPRNGLFLLAQGMSNPQGGRGVTRPICYLSVVVCGGLNVETTLATLLSYATTKKKEIIPHVSVQVEICLLICRPLPNKELIFMLRKGRHSCGIHLLDLYKKQRIILNITGLIRILFLIPVSHLRLPVISIPCKRKYWLSHCSESQRTKDLPLLLRQWKQTHVVHIRVMMFTCHSSPSMRELVGFRCD